jgi:hypothetical protein
MSKVSMKIGSESTFNDGSVGCTVAYATGSVMTVALTGFGYLSWKHLNSGNKPSPG